MLLFWVVLAVLTCAATSFVAWPLLANVRRPAGAAAGITDEARRLAVYRDRRREIEAERDSGRITAEEATRSLDELAAEAAAQFGTAAPEKAAAAAAPAPGGLHWPLVAAVVAALAVPAVGLVLYGKLGSPELVAGVPAGGNPSSAAVDRAISELQARVRKAPEDGQAWANLGEATRIKGDMQASVAAYKKAAALLPNSARVLADYAEALAIAAGGRFDGQPVELLEKALATDPTEIKAVVLMGVAQYHQGNVPRALTLLRKALAGLGEDSPDGQQIAQVIARIESEAGGAGAPGKVASAAPTGKGAAASKGAPAASGAPTAKSGAAVSGTVTIDEAARKSVPAGAVLFVSARLPQGPRIPLAAVRLAAGQWPQPFELGDAQAMDPSRLLSSADQVVIDAHVSTTGSPMRQSGDVFGTSAPVKPGTRGVTVKIDQRVP